MQSLNMFAGVSGSGQSGAELVYLAPLGTPLPGLNGVAKFADLDTAFQSPGLITQDGFSVSQDVSKQEVYSFGMLVQTRTLKTQMKQEGSFTMQETNPLSLDVYNGLPLGTTKVDPDGSFGVERGKIRTQQYCGVIDAYDGAKRLRWVLPIIEIDPAGEIKLTMSEILERPCSVTLSPDSNGNAIYEYYMFPHLATGTPAVP